MFLPCCWNFNNNIKLPQLLCQPALPKFSAHHSFSSALRNAEEPKCQNSLFPPANQSVAAIIFGDGMPSRLYPLTKRRSEGAIPIAGNYRLVDAVVSNCINSNISKIYALTQFNSTSLNSHLSKAYSGAFPGKDGFVEVLAASQDMGWFQGTADAIRKCLWVLQENPVAEFLILPGHHLYEMDYQEMIQAHRSSNAHITVAVHSERNSHSPGFGICKVNSENEVVYFQDETQKIKWLSPPVQNSVRPKRYIGIADFPSMGVFVINADVMTKLLTEYFPAAKELRAEVLPGALALGMKIHAHEFDGYWEDMRSITAFYQANMESTRKTNRAHNKFFDRDSPLYTLPRHLPPTVISDAAIIDSVIGDGCILNSCKIKGSVIGMKTRVGKGSIIEDSVIMGSDTYPMDSAEGDGICNIPIGIGEDSLIRKCIVDKNARIGKNVKIINKDKVVEGNKEAEGYVITEGIVVIIRNAVIPDGTIL